MPCAPASIDAHVAADCPTQERQPLIKRREERLESRIVRGGRQEHADAPHPLALLRAHCKRPHRRAADERDDLAPLQPIELHLLPLTSVTAYRIGVHQVRGLAALRDFTLAYVSNGSWSCENEI